MLKGEGHRGGKFRMARVIMKAPKGLHVDHINWDKLDNRKKNLRVVSAQENQINKGVTKRSSSGYKNVYWNKLEKKWRVAFKTNGKEWHLGYFKDLRKAVIVARQISE